MRPIDADALIETLEQWQRDAEKSRPDDVRLIEFNHGVMGLAQAAVAQIPTLTADDLRPKGEWIPYEPEIALYGCSNCDHMIFHAIDLPGYCSYCGAKMGGANETD